MSSVYGPYAEHWVQYEIGRAVSRTVDIGLLGNVLIANVELSSLSAIGCLAYSRVHERQLDHGLRVQEYIVVVIELV